MVSIRLIAAFGALTLIWACGDDKSATGGANPLSGARASSVAAAGANDGGLTAEADSVAHRSSFRIERLDQVRFVVDSAVLTQLALDIGTRSLEIKRVKGGYRIGAITAGSLLSRLGFLAGDVIASVNGVGLDDIQAVDKAFAAARTSLRIEATLVRGNDTLNRRYVFLSSLYGDVDFSPTRDLSKIRLRPPAAKREFDRLISVMELGVKKTSPSEVEVDRKVLGAMVQGDELLRHGANRYARKGRGLHVIGTESVYGVLGFTSYDTIKMIDDEDVRSRYNLVEQLRSRTAATDIRVSVVRLREPMVIRIRLVDGVIKDESVVDALAAWQQAAGADGIPTMQPVTGGLGSGGGSGTGYPFATRVRPPPAVDLSVYVKKISDTKFDIDRKLLTAGLDQPALFAKARLVPSTRGDGFKIFAVRPGSIIDQLGMKNGDLLHSINGHMLTNPDSALYIYGKVRDAKSLKLRVTRRGSKLTLTYTLKR